jgi:hypothetical protein
MLRLLRLKAKGKLRVISANKSSKPTNYMQYVRKKRSSYYTCKSIENVFLVIEGPSMLVKKAMYI